MRTARRRTVGRPMCPYARNGFRILTPTMVAPPLRSSERSSLHPVRFTAATFGDVTAPATAASPAGA